MSRPFKKAGFRQGIYEISSARKDTVGTLRILADGRKFRYAKAGASALAAGKMSVAAAIDADVTNETAPAAAVGTTVLTLTVTSTTFVKNYFKGGAMHINDAAGEGHAYPISGNSACTASTSTVVTLEESIKIALTTSSEFTLVPSPWMATIESTTEESLPVGIPPVAVTAAYYYWSQTGGPAICLHDGSAAVGTMMTLDATAGAITPINTTLDIDQPIVGIHWGTAGVGGEYKPIFLKID